MTSSIRRFAFCLAFLCAASSAYAATVAKMSCTPSAGPQPFTLAFNVSYFDFGVALTINPPQRGPGSTLTSQPLVVHTSLAQFQSLYSLVTVGNNYFASCTLTTTASTGKAIEFTLSPVAVKEVEPIGHSKTADPTPYTQVTFVYQSVQVTPGS
jgi:hypothetical protein